MSKNIEIIKAKLLEMQDSDRAQFSRSMDQLIARFGVKDVFKAFDELIAEETGLRRTVH